MHFFKRTILIILQLVLIHSCRSISQLTKQKISDNAVLSSTETQTSNEKSFKDGGFWNISSQNDVDLALNALKSSATPAGVDVTLNTVKETKRFKNLWYLLIKANCTICLRTADLKGSTNDSISSSKELFRWMMEQFNFIQTRCTLEYFGYLSEEQAGMLPRETITHLRVIVMGKADLFGYVAAVNRLGNGKRKLQIHLRVDRNIQLEWFDDVKLHSCENVRIWFHFPRLCDDDVATAFKLVTALDCAKYWTMTSPLLLPDSSLTLDGVQTLFKLITGYIPGYSNGAWKYPVFVETTLIEETLKEDLIKDFSSVDGNIFFYLDTFEVNDDNRNSANYCGSTEIGISQLKKYFTCLCNTFEKGITAVSDIVERTNQAVASNLKNMWWILAKLKIV